MTSFIEFTLTTFILVSIYKVQSSANFNYAQQYIRLLFLSPTKKNTIKTC